VTTDALSSSPIIDLTGYRQRATTEPTCVAVVAAMMRPPSDCSSTMFRQCQDPGLRTGIREAEHAAGLRTAHSLLMILARSRIETTPTTASASITGRCRNPPESI